MNLIDMNIAMSYYVLIKINNNQDLDLVNNKIQVIGIFSSRKNAEEKIKDLSLSNLDPKYIIQGPFTIDKPKSDIINQILLPNPRPNPDIYNPDIYNPDIFYPNRFNPDPLGP